MSKRMTKEELLKERQDSLEHAIYRYCYPYVIQADFDNSTICFQNRDYATLSVDSDPNTAQIAMAPHQLKDLKSVLERITCPEGTSYYLYGSDDYPNKGYNERVAYLFLLERLIGFFPNNKSLQAALRLGFTYADGRNAFHIATAEAEHFIQRAADSWAHGYPNWSLR